MIEPRAGHTLLCLHGFLGCGADWLAFSQMIAARLPGWNVLAPDLPGHGRTPPLSHNSIERLAAHVLAELDRSGIPRVALAGYSLGGRVALQLAVMAPDRIVALAGISTTAGIGHAHARAARLEADTQLGAELRAVATPEQWRQFLENWWSQPIFNRSGWTSATARKALASRLPDFEGGGGGCRPAWLAKIVEEASPGNMQNLWPELRRLRLPCLFLAGKRDPKFAEIAARMARDCPDGRVHLIPGCGHALLFEAAAHCARAVAEFALPVHSATDSIRN